MAKKPEPTVAKSEREWVLNTATALTTGARETAYGSPKVNLSCCAELVEVYQRYRQDTDKSSNAAHDIAVINALQKIARIATGQLQSDNYIDGAAYLAIAFELRDE
jgi:hypothetical protein